MSELKEVKDALRKAAMTLTDRVADRTIRLLVEEHIQDAIKRAFEEKVKRLTDEKVKEIVEKVIRLEDYRISSEIAKMLANRLCEDYHIELKLYRKKLEVIE